MKTIALSAIITLFFIVSFNAYFKTKVFIRFARDSMIYNAALCKAIEDADRGLIDADLRNGVIKQRIARTGSGKSTGYHTIVLFKIRELAFLYMGLRKTREVILPMRNSLHLRNLQMKCWPMIIMQL